MKPRTLKDTSFRMLISLSIEFILGMFLNIYVQLPDSHPGSNATDYFSGIVSGIGWALTSGIIGLMLHALIGLALVIFSVLTIKLAFEQTKIIFKVLSVLGALGMLIAAFSGASFVNYGNDSSSFFMAVGFMIGFISYAIILYLAEK